ncbi:MAG: FAD-dependent monooxygenase [Gammaproteobacteria bacterium]|nr:FAD-dependent monooxygenase [Gammaproteobacteria bacterium]
MSTPQPPQGMVGFTLPVYEFHAPPELRGLAPREYPVVIVGAGLAGLTAALELGSRGINTVVLDDDNTVGAAGLSSRGICYAKRTLEIFDRFGVADRIRAKGVTWNEGEVYRGEQLLYRFNLQPEADQKFPAFVNLQQFYVEQYLVERLQTMPAVDLRWLSKVVGITQNDDSVTLHVETPAGNYATTARYVIAADGGHSAVRTLIQAEDEERSLSDDRWCIADVKMDTTEEAVRKAYLDGVPTEGGAIWYHQMADGVWRTDWQIGHLADPDAEVTPARAALRLRKLVGPAVNFELVWVGPWRFKKRLLKRFVHGHVLFVGDAAHEHSPFGARGGNSGVQDANNLAWKLAWVLTGKAHADLLETYHEERYFAARDNLENATRSATFIGPQTDGERLIRNAILDLAQQHDFARPLVNVGRLSVATVYRNSPLNRERGVFAQSLAGSGAAAPDSRYREGFFVDQLKGDFLVAYFGGEGSPLDVHTISLQREGHETFFDRYGVPAEGATYVFRPDGHVLARCTGIDAAFARDAITAVLNYRSGQRGDAAAEITGEKLTEQEIDRLYDALARLVDDTPSAERERILARLVVTLATRLGNYAQVLEAIQLSK